MINILTMVLIFMTKYVTCHEYDFKGMAKQDGSETDSIINNNVYDDDDGGGADDYAVIILRMVEKLLCIKMAMMTVKVMMLILSMVRMKITQKL